MIEVDHFYKGPLIGELVVDQADSNIGSIFDATHQHCGAGHDGASHVSRLEPEGQRYAYRGPSFKDLMVFFREEMLDLLKIAKVSLRPVRNIVKNSLKSELEKGGDMAENGNKFKHGNREVGDGFAVPFRGSESSSMVDTVSPCEGVEKSVLFSI
jgi:hypothetical protein